MLFETLTSEHSSNDIVLFYGKILLAVMPFLRQTQQCTNYLFKRVLSYFKRSVL